jgi:3-oxoacyl-[acyl-carrier protein] reductase
MAGETRGAVIVTGGASGIGKATVRRLLEEQLPVAVLDADQSALDACAQEFAACGPRIASLRSDVTNEDDVRAAVTEAIEVFGAVDGLVNSAGIVPREPIGELTLAAWNRTLAVNLTGGFLLCRACLDHMKERRRGSVVNVASLAGQNGGILVSPAYTASKAGLIALTKAVAREGAPSGVRCNAVAPGPVITPATESWGREALEGLAAAIPLGRLGRPDEIARAICFLLSEDASFITGATLDVNGGLLMR